MEGISGGISGDPHLEQKTARIIAVSFENVDHPSAASRITDTSDKWIIVLARSIVYVCVLTSAADDPNTATH